MTRELQDEFTIERFERGAIDPARFDHEAHVYVAWLFLDALPQQEATRRFDEALQRFTRQVGAAAKYNAMITWLFLLLIAERRRDGETWVAFRARNSDLVERRPRSQAA